MSLGKLTLLSADCDGSGAVVGSSGMVADSSGVDGAGCPGGAAGGTAVDAAAGVAGALPAADVLATVGDLGALVPRAVADAKARPAVSLEAIAFVDTDAGTWRVDCSAARSVTSAAPDRTTPLRVISQIDRLFSIAHHPKAYCCTGAVRAVTPGQSQVRCSGGLPIGTPYDMAGAVLRAQWVRDWR
jgi:hypothetical protein